MLGDLSRPGAAGMRIALGLVAALAACLCFFGSEAKAAPGANQVLIAETSEELAKKLGSQVAAFPDVARVDLVDTENNPPPSAAQLAPYDLVVSIGDSTAFDNEAWGNALAAYVDGGGVVVSTTYDTWDGGGAPTGRWETGGYAPFLLGDNDNELTTLGSFDAASPLMRGVAPGSLETELNTTNTLAPGATLVASWADGRPAVAFKGRVVNISAYIGDGYGEVWNGNFGQIVVNTVRMLGKQRLTVANANPAGGTVTGSAGGISCGTVCGADFLYQTPVGLLATANKGFAFSGFTGSCTGATCALTMDAPKSVTANFAAYGFGKGIKRNKKKGTAKVPVTVAAPGTLVLSGKKIKPRTRAVPAGTTKLTVAAKGKARKKLLKTGKVKVQLTLTFTPAGGTPATATKTVQLKRIVR